MEANQGERIAVLETKVDDIHRTQAAILEEMRGIRDIVQQSKGAGRLMKYAATFFGMTTVAALSAKISALSMWFGK